MNPEQINQRLQDMMDEFCLDPVKFQRHAFEYFEELKEVLMPFHITREQMKNDFLQVYAQVTDSLFAESLRKLPGPFAGASSIKKKRSQKKKRKKQ